jgi:SAM-dependent methyltransferase
VQSASVTRLNPETFSLLRCAVCRGKLKLRDRLQCVNPTCGTGFPVLDGVPILINDANSLFSVADFQHRRGTFFRPSSLSPGRISSRLPRLGRNVSSRRNFAHLARLLLDGSSSPRVLILGGGIEGNESQSLLARPGIECVESDVSFGPRTALICDAHDIPFEDATLDGVVAQAVLEHVVDPNRCAQEIHRVLKPGGLVYAETPFMQQVHGGRYDFNRFTHLGHRRLFRQFEEVSSGAVSGPGAALAWSYQYFLLSFAGSARSRALARVVARLTAFWLKWFDPRLIERPGTLDAASGYYFLGRKSDQTLSDRDLIAQYRGAT